MQATPFALRLDWTVDAITIGVAIVLQVLARALLPKQDRSRLRIAAIYLGLALAFRLADALVPETSSAERVLAFLYWFFVLASTGRSLVIIAVDVVFGRKRQQAPPRIFRDLTQAVVYVIVVMFTLRAIGVEPSSLLTTSALLTAVVGLALQDTLGNLVSGLALQMQRPFEVGDWIQFDEAARQVGQVTEVNWRATTVMTSDLVEVIVPNASLAKTPIRNFSRPSPIMRRSVTVQASYAASPNRVQAAILAALRDAPGVLEDPPPWVQTKSFADSGIEYAIYFFANDFASRERIDGAVRDRIWHGMQRASLEIPFPTRTVQMHQVTDESEQRREEKELARRDKVLRCVDFLNVLDDATHRALAAAATVRLYAPGEIIVSQGDSSTELFIIDRGEVSVELTRTHGAVPVAKLGPGKFFGEMALMTGETRKATVRAATDCELLVVDHGAFHETLSSSPGVVEKVSDLLATRQAELEAVASETGRDTMPMQERSQRLISQIKSFFNI